MRDTSVLDNIIYGRVDPHIYAFSTNTIPNYLKVGDTYRPVSIPVTDPDAAYNEEDDDGIDFPVEVFCPKVF